MRAAEEITAHEFLCDCLEIVVEDDDVVAVPTDAPAHVQQDFRQERKDRAQLVDDRLGRVVVPGVECIQDTPGQRVSEIELVRAHGVALEADAEQLAFHRIEIQRAIDRLLEDGVERLDETFARA